MIHLPILRNTILYQYTAGIVSTLFCTGWKYRIEIFLHNMRTIGALLYPKIFKSEEGQVQQFKSELTPLAVVPSPSFANMKSSNLIAFSKEDRKLFHQI